MSLVAAACSNGPATRAARPTDSSGLLRRSVPDSELVPLRGPTLIAFFPRVTQAQVDSSEDLATVLDDFAYHLSAARDSLLALGFVIVERPHGPLVVVEGSRSRDIIPATDSADVGYVFVAPGRREQVLYGVRTNTDLIEAARTFLQPTRK